MQAKEIQIAFHEKNSIRLHELYDRWSSQSVTKQKEGKSIELFLAWLYLNGDVQMARDLLAETFTMESLCWNRRERLLYKALYYEFCGRCYNTMYSMLQMWKPRLVGKDQTLPFGYLYWRLMALSMVARSTDSVKSFIETYTKHVGPSNRMRWYLFCGLVLSQRSSSTEGFSYFPIAAECSLPQEQWKCILMHCRQWKSCVPRNGSQFGALVEKGRNLAPVNSKFLFDVVYVDWLLFGRSYNQAVQYSLAHLETCSTYGLRFRHYQLLLAAYIAQNDFSTAFEVIHSQTSRSVLSRLKKKNDPLFGEVSGMWQVYQLILLAKYGEQKQVDFIEQELTRLPKWKGNVPILCGIMNFYLNPTNHHFSLQQAEKYWNVILNMSSVLFQGDVFVMGTRLYILKDFLSRKNDAVGCPSMQRFQEWVQEVFCYHPSSGYYYAMFFESYEDYSHFVIDRVIVETYQELNRFRQLFECAFRGTPIPLQEAKRFRQLSRFGDFYQHVPTCTELFPLRQLL